MITYEVQINLASQIATPIIQAVQGDTGRSFSFVLSDFTIPDGATATYYVQKPSGEAVYNSATISGNSVICDMTAQSLAEVGENPMQIRITSDGQVVTSFEVILMVREFYGEGAVESGSESNIFDQAVEAAAEQFQTNAEAIADEVIESIPSDYTALSNEVDELNERLGQYENIFTGDVDESVKNWLDDHPEATTTVQDWSLTYKKLVIGTLDYVTPQMFGAKGDGVTDDASSFYDMFDWMIANGICIAFVPQGTYCTSRSLSVPSSCALIGTGYKSFIYLTTATNLGVALTNGGSNVSIQNIRVGNLNDSTAISSSGYGGIGISVYSYATVKNNALTEKANCSNIKIKDIYATGSYPLQVESGNGYVVSDVCVENIYAENGLISITAPSGALQKNISVNKVVCDVLRLDYGTGNSEGISVSNIRANYVRLNSPNSINCSLNNALVETESTSLYKATFNSNSALYVSGNLSINNVKITNNDSVTYGVYVYGGNSKFTNVKVTNAFATKNIEARVSDKQIFICCDFGSVASTVYGYGYSTSITLVGGTQGQSAYIDDTTEFELTPNSTLTNASSDFPIVIERLGTECRLRLYKVVTKIERDDLIATIQNSSFRPKNARRVKARAFNVDGSASYNIELTINTDGTVKVAPIYALTLSNYISANRIYVNDDYLL